MWDAYAEREGGEDAAPVAEMPDIIIAFQPIRAPSPPPQPPPSPC